MSNRLKLAMAGALALVVAALLGLYAFQPGGLFGPSAPSPPPEPTPAVVHAHMEVRPPGLRGARNELPRLTTTTNALVVTTRPERPIVDWDEPWGPWLRDGNVMTFVDVDRREVVERQLPELVFGATSLHQPQLRAAERLAFFGANHIYAIDPDPAGEPEPILALASDTFISPSGLPGEIWVYLGRDDEARRLLLINSRGEVLLGPVRWRGNSLTAGLPTLVVADKEVWDPVGNRRILRLPGGEFESLQLAAGSAANRFTWCEGGFPCTRLHLTDMDVGATRLVAEFPEDNLKFRPEQGGLSPDGRYLAATICVDGDRLCAVAVLDLDTNTSWTIADGWVGVTGITGGATRPAWSPDGQWVFFQLNDGRLAAYSPGDPEAQIVDVPALDPAIGFAVTSAPDDSTVGR